MNINLREQAIHWGGYVLFVSVIVGIPLGAEALVHAVLRVL